MKCAMYFTLCTLLTTVAFADDVTVQAGRGGLDVAVDRTSDATIPRNLEKSDRAMRTSELVGLAVRNNADEELGEIEELVIDLNSGKVRYAAVSMGGFLGVGDKLFAVPFEAITFRTHREDGVLGDSTERVAIVNVNKQALESAEGFDQDHWPNFADQNWRKVNDRPYRTNVRIEANRRVQNR